MASEDNYLIYYTIYVRSKFISILFNMGQVFVYFLVLWLSRNIKTKINILQTVSELILRFNFYRTTLLNSMSRFEKIISFTKIRNYIGRYYKHLLTWTTNLWLKYPIEKIAIITYRKYNFQLKDTIYFSKLLSIKLNKKK